ncbi:MAG: hypothetical protein WJU30_00519 [Candidatus Phytoplasma pruni]
MLFRKGVYYSFDDFWNKAVEINDFVVGSEREVYGMCGWDNSRQAWTNNLTGYNWHEGNYFNSITGYKITRLLGGWFVARTSYLSLYDGSYKWQSKPFFDGSDFIKFDYDVYKGNSTKIATYDTQEVAKTYLKYKQYLDKNGNVVKQETLNPQGEVINTQTRVTFYQRYYENYDTITIYKNIDFNSWNRLKEIDIYHREYYLQKNISPIL